jgi:hypothetical protein
MASQPPTPPPQDLTRAALEFARATAQSEIASIDRLHQRTLRALGAIIWLFAATGAVLGYFGYSNLRNLAVDTAQKQMQQTVTDQITARMSNAQIDQIVQNALQARTQAQLEQVINRQVAKELDRRQPEILHAVKERTGVIVFGMKSKIDEIASIEAKRLVTEQLAPRRFTKEQSDLLKEASEPYNNQHFMVVVRGYSSSDPEEVGFADQILTALRAAGWAALSNPPPAAGLPPQGGIFILVFDLKHLPKGANELRSVLKAANVDAPIVEGTTQSYHGAVSTYTANGIEYEIPNLIVGSRFPH